MTRGRRRCGRLALSALAVALAFASMQARAVAQTPPAEVRLQLEPCPSANYDSAALAALLQVELRGLGVASVKGAAPGAPVAAEQGVLAWVRLACAAAPNVLAMEWIDLASGQRVQRELAVADVEPPDRARALSIAIASALESAWTSLAVQPRGPAPLGLPDAVRLALRQRASEALRLQPMAAGPAAALPLPRREPRWLVSAALAARAFPSRATGVFGVDVTGMSRFAERVRIGFEVEAMFGRQLLRDAEGVSAELDVLWLSTAVGLYLSSKTTPELIFGPSVRLGYARVTGSSSDMEVVATDAQKWLFEAGGTAWLRFQLGAGWDGYLGCEVGYVPGGITFVADGVRAVSFADVTVALRIGAGVSF